MTDYQDSVCVLGKGTVLNGHFQVEEVLGAGGFGITYRAIDRHLDRAVAIKEFYPSAWVSRNNTSSATVTPISTQHGLLFTAMKEKFIEEAKAIARLDSSTHVVKVFSYFEENGTAYIVMEYLNGVTLRKHVEKHGKMDPDELCRLMIPLIRALNVVHSYKLIHRDIAPDNIMLMPDCTLKLMDFGAARSFSEDTNKSMSVILKHGFAPFEQYQRRGKQGAWTDIYALSATMYYCVTGMIPESAADRIANDSLRRPSEIGIPIRPALEDALMKGLATLAEERYQTAMDMAAAFDDAMHSIWNRRVGGPGQTVVDDEPEKDKAEERRDADGQKKEEKGETKERHNAEKPTREQIGENSEDNEPSKEEDDPGIFQHLELRFRRMDLLTKIVVILLIGAVSLAIVNKSEQIKPPVGTTVYFGQYEQDNDLANGKEAIAWRVLEVEGDRALLISEQNLDCQPYNKVGTSVTWETCTLRTWLNSTFLSAAFTEAEQRAILTTMVKNEDNPQYGTDGGKDTQDKVFLLSIGEVEALFHSYADRIAKNTAYAWAQGAYDSGAGRWWLRSPGSNQNGAAYVNTAGSVYRLGGDVNNGYYAVRPALWINLISGIATIEAP